MNLTKSRFLIWLIALFFLGACESSPQQRITEEHNTPKKQLPISTSKEVASQKKWIYRYQETLDDYYHLDYSQYHNFTYYLNQQNNPDKTWSILDYYERLPAFFLSNRGENILYEKAFYQSQITYKNISNGYLRFRSTDRVFLDSSCDYEMALFRFENQDIIALNSCDCFAGRFFFTLNNGIWKNITTNVFDPKPRCSPCGDFYYYIKLPEYGTEIIAYEGLDGGCKEILHDIKPPHEIRQMFRANWQNDKFIIKYVVQ